MGLKTLVVFFGLCLVSINWWVQPLRSTKREHPSSSPLFLYQTYNFASEDSSLSRLDVYVDLAYDILQFVKQDLSSFKASYEVEINLFNEGKEYVAGKLWEEEIVVHSFQEACSKTKFSRSEASFDLKPGKYTLSVTITDLDIKKSFQRTKQVELKDFNKERIGLSDVVFADAIEVDSSGIKDITPNLRGALENAESDFYAYFEIYPRIPVDSLQVNYNIIDSFNRSVVKRSHRVDARRQRIREFINLKSLLTKPGGYYLIIEVCAGGYKNGCRKKFYIGGEDLPIFMENLDSAIQPMRYIAKPSDFKAMVEAKGEEKQRLFDEFWRKRDPTPGTKTNELKEEFYRRVEYVNRRFTVYFLNKDGWQTDRGRIYIIYGPPSEVERIPATINSPPCEVWHYKHLDRTFLFIDRSGIGDFELVRVE